jgi:hypothetical protein
MDAMFLRTSSMDAGAAAAAPVFFPLPLPGLLGDTFGLVTLLALPFTFPFPLTGFLSLNVLSDGMIDALPAVAAINFVVSMLA